MIDALFVVKSKQATMCISAVQYALSCRRMFNHDFIVNTSFVEIALIQIFLLV